MRSWWFWVGGVLGAVTVVVLVVVWLIDRDAKYIPLAAALVSGTATLVGVAVAALVLRFHYRTQANPLRLEFFKRQWDAANNLTLGAYAVYDETYALVTILESLKGKKPAAQKPVIRKQINTITESLLSANALGRDIALAMHGEISISLERFLNTVGEVVHWTTTSADPVELQAELDPLLKKLNDIFKLLIASCVIFAGGGELPGDVAVMMGVDTTKLAIEFKERIEEQERSEADKSPG